MKKPNSIIPSTEPKTVVVKTFWAKIYVGFKNRNTGRNVGSMRKTRKICQQFCDDISYCVTVSPTEYRYYKGHERGAVVGLINYPRFPEHNFQTKIYAKQLAEKLMFAFKQYKVSIVFPDETIMLSIN